MASKNTSHLAGEFLVAGELSRRGYPVSITMGNAKAVDIYAEIGERDEKGEVKAIKIDAKAAQKTRSWPVGKIDETIYYIFVYLQTKNDINKREPTPPQYFVARGEEIKNLVKR